MSGTEWQIGDHVRVRGASWTIREAERWAHCTTLTLSRDDGQRSARSLLTPFDRPARLDRSRRIGIVRKRRWLHELRRWGAGMVPYGGARVAARAAVSLLPHQLEPLLAVLRHGATRLLIADAVGLGKTIQAGLMLLELSARDSAFRAIVIVPAGLREQWGAELEERFGLAIQQADAGWLRRAATELPRDINPWSLPGIVIASIDFAKRPEVLRALEDVFWDIAIVDEAHLASASSDRRAAAHAVARRARRTVLLTATPDSGDPAAFAALCSIGSLDPADTSLVFFRRTRADVADGRPRRSVFLRVQPTPTEVRMHELLERYTALVWREAGRRQDPRARLATIVLRKRAISSAASLALSAQRRLDLLSGTCLDTDRQLLLPLADEDPLADDVCDGDLAVPGLSDARRESRWLAAIAEAARHAARRESKTTRLLRWLARVREPVLVFTEYRDTLHRLERAIRATGRAVATLHGGLDRSERVRVQAAFNAGGLSLLATDAAAEGLNLHHHCRIVMHYELPWRPARIEQRAGRVDRLGQERRVHEIALIAAGTAERLVLAPLALRAARARAAGGTAAGLLDSLSESAVSELIMEGILPTPSASSSFAKLPRAADLRDEAAQEVARLLSVRRWLGQSPEHIRRSGRRPVIVVTTLCARQRGVEPGLVLVFARTLTDGNGRIVHSEPWVVRLARTAGERAGRSARSLRRLVEQVQGLCQSPGTSLCEMLAPALDAMAGRVGQLHRTAHDAQRLRERALGHSQRSAAAQMVQSGLFDRRAIREGRRRDHVRAARLEESDAHLRSLDRGEALVASIALTHAVLVVRGRP